MHHGSGSASPSMGAHCGADRRPRADRYPQHSYGGEVPSQQPARRCHRHRARRDRGGGHRCVRALAGGGGRHRIALRADLSLDWVCARAHRPRSHGRALQRGNAATPLAVHRPRRRHRVGLRGRGSSDPRWHLAAGTSPRTTRRPGVPWARLRRRWPAELCSCQARGGDAAPGHGGAAAHRARAPRRRLPQHFNHQCAGGRGGARDGRAAGAGARGAARHQRDQQRDTARTARHSPGLATGG